jgi:SAM-dependent methyltransferase
MLPDFLTYDFDYSWPYLWGHALVFLVAAAAGGVCYWRGRRGWATLLGSVALWGLAGAGAMHHAVQINAPVRLVTDAFLPSGRGRVLDLGAGSGRATVGLLLARPSASVTAVDRYRGYYGIDDNNPDRLRLNARIAGVQGRVDVQTADMRELPFGSHEFDAAISVAAIDHLRRDDIERAMRETARVLKPGGQFLIVSLNVDGWVRMAMPVAGVHGHGYWGNSANRTWWQEALQRAGFEMERVGTAPATVYFLAKKKASGTTVESTSLDRGVTPQRGAS